MDRDQYLAHVRSLFAGSPSKPYSEPRILIKTLLALYELSEGGKVGVTRNALAVGVYGRDSEAYLNRVRVNMRRIIDVVSSSPALSQETSSPAMVVRENKDPTDPIFVDERTDRITTAYFIEFLVIEGERANRKRPPLFGAPVRIGPELLNETMGSFVSSFFGFLSASMDSRFSSDIVALEAVVAPSAYERQGPSNYSSWTRYPTIVTPDIPISIISDIIVFPILSSKRNQTSDRARHASGMFRCQNFSTPYLAIDTELKFPEQKIEQTIGFVAVNGLKIESNPGIILGENFLDAFKASIDDLVGPAILLKPLM